MKNGKDTQLVSTFGSSHREVGAEKCKRNFRRRKTLVAAARIGGIGLFMLLNRSRSHQPTSTFSKPNYNITKLPTPIPSKTLLAHLPRLLQFPASGEPTESLRHCSFFFLKCFSPLFFENGREIMSSTALAMGNTDSLGRK